jgi:hypothetical protein
MSGKVMLRAASRPAPRSQHVGHYAAGPELRIDPGGLGRRGRRALRVNGIPLTWTLLGFIVFVLPCPPTSTHFPTPLALSSAVNTLFLCRNRGSHCIFSSSHRISTVAA